MVRLSRRLALAGLLLGICGFSTQASAAQETVTVSRRPWFGVCSGVCPNFVVAVSADGQVVVKHGNTKERFRVSRAEAAEFRAKLQSFRPVGEQPGPLVCSHHVRPEDAPLVMKVREIEIRWSGTSHRTRLAACDDARSAELIEAIRQALWSVHLYINGARRD